MAIDFHAFTISFAICSLLNGCTQTGDGFQDNEQTKVSIENGKLAGWSMMNRQDRSELRQKLLSMKSYQECTDYIEHDYQMMHARTPENVSSRPIIQTDICHRMKSAGMFR